MAINVTGLEFDYKRAGNGTVRFYADAPFEDSDGVYHPTQAAGGPDYITSVAFAASAGVAACATFSLPDTEQSATNQEATLTAIVFNSAGRADFELFSGLRVPASLGPTITYTQLLLHNDNLAPLRDTSVYTKEQTNLLLTEHDFSGGLATDLLPGRVRLSKPAADPALPEVVGTNDLATTLGHGIVQYASSGVSSSSKAVRADDERLGAAPAVATASLGAATTEGRLRKKTDGNRAVVVATGQQYVEVGGSAYNAKMFGAVGDGPTDDRTALNSLIAAFNQTGGLIYMPRGDYKISGALDAITAPGKMVGDGRGDAHFYATEPVLQGTATPVPTVYGTRIVCTSPTAHLFTVKTGYFKFEGLYLRNLAGSTPSAGAGIRVYNDIGNVTYTAASGGSFNSVGGDFLHQVDYTDVKVEGFYDNWDIQIADDWRMFNCYGVNPVRYSARIRNTAVLDAGGWSIIGGSFLNDQGTSPTQIAVKVESCGGAKIIAVNILGYLHAVDLDTAGSTSVFNILGNSFENNYGAAVKATNCQLIQVVGNEIANYENSSPAKDAPGVHFDGVTRSLVVANNFRAPYNNAQVAVLLNNCVGIKGAGTNHASGYAREWGFTGTYARDPDERATYRRPTLLNGWTDFVTTVEYAGYNLIGGTVKLCGGVNGGTLHPASTATPLPIFNLPVGYRPNKRHVQIVASDTGSCQIWVEPNGDVCQAYGTSNSSVFLDGVEFVPYPVMGA